VGLLGLDDGGFDVVAADAGYPKDVEEDFGADKEPRVVA
jgi:hypothetical protein